MFRMFLDVPGCPRCSSCSRMFRMFRMFSDVPDVPAVRPIDRAHVLGLGCGVAQVACSSCVLTTLT